jgi:hypothetical protein
MNTKKISDPFGPPNEGKYDSSKANRDVYGRDDETVPGFAPLDATGHGIGSRNLKRFLGSAAQAAEDANRPRRFTLHASGQELGVQVTRRGTMWVAFVPFNGEWREFQSSSYDKLTALLLETFNQGPAIRRASESGRLTVARLCTEGRLDAALESYVKDRCPDITPDSINDIRYRELFIDAAWEIFRLSTPDCPADDPEIQAAMKRHLGDRPATLPGLRAAWLACQRGLIVGVGQQKTNDSETPRISDADLEKLSNENISELYGGVVRERATEERKFRDSLRGQ